MPSRIKILMLTTSYPISSRSSSGIFIKRLVDNIINDVNVKVLTPANNDFILSELSDEIITFNYSVRKWQKLANVSGGIPGALQNNKLYYFLVPMFIVSMFYHCLLNSKNCDLIHANWSICGMIAGIVGGIRKIPVVTTIRGEDVARAKESLIYKLLLTACVRLSNNVVSVSDSINKWLSENYINDKYKFAVITNGINNELLNIQRHNKANKDKTIIKFITVGSLIKRKGIDVIIKAINQIENPRPLKFAIVGDGPELNNLKELIKLLRMEDVIMLTGEIEPSGVSTYLADSDIFILASHSEGRPNALLEAMAAGMPIIASNIDGNNELISHDVTGLLFKDNSTEELIRRIDDLINNSSKMMRLGIAAREKIIEKELLWTNTGRKYIELYKNI